MIDVPVEEWQRVLSAATAHLRDPPVKVVVYPQLESTQDQAREMQAVPGAVIIAGRQTRGRGRFGRAWADTADEGVAMTLVIRKERPERLAIAAGVAVAMCVDGIARVGPHRRFDEKIGIKWPNDIVAGGRKLAGVLIEQTDDRALVGIGVNVGQTDWPADLADRAISLQQLGVETSRLNVALLIILALRQVASISDDSIVRAFMRFDILAGMTCGFRVGEREVRGKVLRVDPMNGLAVLTENEGEVWLPAATTTVIKEE